MIYHRISEDVWFLTSSSRLRRSL